MGRNLTNLTISSSFQYLLQVSESNKVNTGLGADVNLLDITSSYANSATSASHALNADSAISASFATTALKIGRAHV